MPRFSQAIDTLKIPIKGLTPEQAGTAPTSPAFGQEYVDTTVTPKVIRAWDGAAWIPLNRYTGIGADNFVAGNDAALTNTRIPTDDSVTAAKVNTTLKGGAAAATEALRALGATATTALAGNTRLDQLAVPTAPVSLNNQRLTNVAASTTGTDVVIRNELDASRQGYAGTKDPVDAIATTNINTAAAPATIDTVAPGANVSVLLTAQTTTTQNGIYAYTAAGIAMVRRTDADAVDEIKDGTTVGVGAGTSAGSVWIQNAAPVGAPGAWTQTWVNYNPGGAAYTAGAGLLATGNTFDVIAADGSITVAADSVTVGNVPVTKGGTGATTADVARVNLGVPWFKANLAALTAGTPLTVTHSLGTLDVVVEIYEIATGETVYFDVKRTTTAAVTVTSGISYALDLYRILVKALV